MAQVQIADVMTRGVRTLTPDDTIVLAAQAMAELDIGAIPVCRGASVVGVVTDRDITVRGVAQGRPVEQIALRDVMSADVRCCYEDQPIADVLEQMRDAQIRRVPVLDRDEHLVGMVSLGDLAVKGDGSDGSRAGQALEEISQPAAPDRSSQSQASGPAGGGSASGQAPV
jgi:CBS domain-containing protein